jgi:hypothetical protein
LDRIAARVDTAPTEKAPLHFGERWLAAKYFGAAETKARCGTANTETSILLFANSISLAKHKIIDRKIRLGNSEMLISYKSNFDRRTFDRRAFDRRTSTGGQTSCQA